MEFWLKMDRVMENYEQKVMEKSWNFTNKFLILMNWHRYVAVFQNPPAVYVD